MLTEHPRCQVVTENPAHVLIHVVDCWCGKVHQPVGMDLIHPAAAVEWVRK